jgi:hypothetical protein
MSRLANAPKVYDSLSLIPDAPPLSSACTAQPLDPATHDPLGPPVALDDAGRFHLAGLPPSAPVALLLRCPAGETLVASPALTSGVAGAQVSWRDPVDLRRVLGLVGAPPSPDQVLISLRLSAPSGLPLGCATLHSAAPTLYLDATGAPQPALTETHPNSGAALLVAPPDTRLRVNVLVDGASMTPLLLPAQPAGRVLDLSLTLPPSASPCPASATH